MCLWKLVVVIVAVGACVVCLWLYLISVFRILVKTVFIIWLTNCDVVCWLVETWSRDVVDNRMTHRFACLPLGLNPCVNLHCPLISGYFAVHHLPRVNSTFYPLWDGKMSTSQMAVMLCGWEGNCRPGGWVIVTCVRADCLWCTPGSAPGPRLGNEYGKPLPSAFCNLPPTVAACSWFLGCCRKYIDARVRLFWYHMFLVQQTHH